MRITRKQGMAAGGFALALALTAVAMLSTQREADGTFDHSVTDAGDDLYRYTGDLTPALPRDPQRAKDYDDLLVPLSLDAFLLDAPVTPADAVEWRDGRGWQIRVTGKTCSDGIPCVDRVRVRPDAETRLRNLDAAFDNARLVGPDDYDAWPFTVDRAVLRCTPPKVATLITAEQVYALNAPARAAAGRDIAEILRDHPLRAGEKVAFGPLFFDAIALCDPSGRTDSGGRSTASASRPRSLAPSPLSGDSRLK